MAYVIPFVLGIIAYAGAISAGASLFLAGLAYAAVSVLAALLLNGDKGANKTRPDQLTGATATEARPIPVIWGSIRLPGNILRYDEDQFTNTKVIEHQGGIWGFGEKDIVVEYRYYLSYDYGLCMGAVDRVTRVIANPGEEIVWEGNISEFPDSNTIIPLKGEKKGGDVIFYCGTETQTRTIDDVYDDGVSNHRQVCFVHLKKHYIGRATAPSSYLFEMQRLPKCYNANDTLIPGMFVRGSTDSEHPAYEEANPAAIIYEAFTNKIWGRGMTPDLIDIQAFINASAYYADQNVGMSFSIGNQDSIDEIVNTIKDHCQLLVFTKDGLLTCRAISDPGSSYNPRIRINRDMLSEIQMSRPSWSSAPNEVRATFINRENNFKNEVVVAQDLASIQMANTINSREVTLNGFSNRQTAEVQVYRILAEASYPAATLTAILTRFHADLEPGSFCELVLDDYHDGEPVTTYWRVADLDDSEQDPEGIKITLTEDYYATSFEGTSADFIIPTPSYELIEALENDDLSAGDDFTRLTNPGQVTDLKIIELPISLTRGAEMAVVVIDAETSGLNFLDANYRIFGALDYEYLWRQRLPRGVFGTLPNGLPAGNRLQRNQAIEVSILAEWQREIMVEATGIVETSADHFADLLKGGSATAFIGSEIVQIGYCISTATGVEIKTIARGCFGTPISSHATETPIVFIENIDDGSNLLRLASLPRETVIQFELQRYSLRGHWGDNDIIPEAEIGYQNRLPFAHLKVKKTESGSEDYID